MEKMLYMYVLLFPFFFFSLPLISPLVAATSIYHFLIAAIKFFVFFLTKLVSFVFIFRSSPFSIIHVNRVIGSWRADDFLKTKNQIF